MHHTGGAPLEEPAPLEEGALVEPLELPAAVDVAPVLLDPAVALPDPAEETVMDVALLDVPLVAGVEEARELVVPTEDAERELDDATLAVEDAPPDEDVPPAMTQIPSAQRLPSAQSPSPLQGCAQPLAVATVSPAQRCVQPRPAAVTCTSAARTATSLVACMVSQR